MVGENRLGKLVPQTPTEKELLTQRPLRSESSNAPLLRSVSSGSLSYGGRVVGKC